MEGDIDLGIVGFDMFHELAGDNEDLVVIHDNLDFGRCHLSLAIPAYNDYSLINTVDELLNMQTSEGCRWTVANPLRIVTGYPRILAEFFEARGFHDYSILGGDGALEAAPAMGSADIIFDLVSTGVTLRENNLKEIDGGQVCAEFTLCSGSVFHNSVVLQIMPLPRLVTFSTIAHDVGEV